MSLRTSLLRGNSFRQYGNRNYFAMRKFIVTIVGVFALLAAFLFPAQLAAQDAKFDSDSISGLGARNIGSAAMSGRVSALTAVKEDGRLSEWRRLVEHSSKTINSE